MRRLCVLCLLLFLSAVLLYATARCCFFYSLCYATAVRAVLAVIFLCAVYCATAVLAGLLLPRRRGSGAASIVACVLLTPL